MLEAAQLALFTMGSDNLTLVPRDTTGTVQGAADAAKAVIADGAKLIIGPLVADEVEAVKPIAARLPTSTSSLSPPRPKSPEATCF